MPGSAGTVASAAGMLSGRLGIATTGGDVLCVPLAAVSAGAGGDSRVELVRADGTTVLAPVDVGLTAEGFAEIHPRQVAVAAGDRVVVGR